MWRRSVWPGSDRSPSPALDMYDVDREHPSIYGTYLATCVVYATVYVRNPTGFTYVPPGISLEVAGSLQRTAWQAVQDYAGGKL